MKNINQNDEINKIGVQHLALKTDDIFFTMRELRFERNERWIDDFLNERWDGMRYDMIKWDGYIRRRRD